jgi:hypothetical protein
MIPQDYPDQILDIEVMLFLMAREKNSASAKRTVLRNKFCRILFVECLSYGPQNGSLAEFCKTTRFAESFFFAECLSYGLQNKFRFRKTARFTEFCKKLILSSAKRAVFPEIASRVDLVFQSRSL